MKHELNLMCCPTCSIYMNKAANFQDGARAPKHDDFCVCANCGELLCYIVKDGKYSVRKTTEEDTLVAIGSGVWRQLLDAQAYVRSKANRFHNIKREELQ